ncbi:MAG TPA: hypothetical protein VFO29_09095 [Candidatus Rubrimentiphilum sp.]|nr:hypothetical protein [Candidatus Rubrimentiphilum sp.]
MQLPGVCAYFLIGLLLAQSSPGAAQSGIAFDEFEKPNVTRPLPLPSDFERVWTDALALGRTLKPYDPKVVSPRAGLLEHVAILGNKIRIENVFQPDLVEIDTLGQANGMFLNLATHTYWAGKASSYLPPFTAADIGVLTTPGTPVLDATVHPVSDSWPNITVSGMTFDGTTTRTIIQTNAAPPCRPATGVVETTIFSAPAVPEQRYQEEFYLGGAPLIWAHLAALTHCSLRAASLVDHLGGYPGFLLYRAMMLQVGGPGTDLMPFPAKTIADVMMRGHIMLLTDADAGLFAIPPGFVRRGP